jgi:hypothetical protein
MSSTPINERTSLSSRRLLRQRLARIALPIACVGAAVAMAAAGVASAQEASWRYAPALAPPPPAGDEAAPYPVPLGVVGEISFWAPNRGLLIAGGTEEHGGGPVPSGIYAWDGETWHQLATVCGSAEGRIVWAGPDEFWTISDQRAGQLIASSKLGEYAAPAVSLCHFVGAEVVGSYAVPLEEPSSWQHMTGGACYTPTDCWFGGGDGQYPNVGAFHLHWNGSTVSAVYEPEDHSVVGMASFNGGIYESVQIDASDARIEGEGADPAVIHTIAPEATEQIFSDFNIVSQATGKLLPEYGKEVQPEALYGFDLASNAPAGSAANQLWAMANAVAVPPKSSKPTTLTILHDTLLQSAGGGVEEAWSQLAPNGGTSQLAGANLAGSQTSHQWGLDGAVAPEPGSQRAWISLRSNEGSALVEQLEAATCEPTTGVTQPCAKVLATDQPLEEGENVGALGGAGPIDCPAAQDCWLATYTEAQGKQSGWLLHLTDGAPEEPNTDKLFDGEDGVIAYRPPDSGVPGVYPDGFGEDDSLENQQTIKAAAEPKQKATSKSKPRPKPKRLVKDVKSKLLHHRTLVIDFTLTAKAHVQLVASRRAAVVAKTRRETLHPGHHSLSITLDPRRWPTKLKFEAKPIGAGGGSSKGSSEEPGSGNVVGT